MTTVASPLHPAPAQVAKGALRRLAAARLEPTPENYARAYAEESGQPAAPALDTRLEGPVWAGIVERLVRGLDRGGRRWTAARKKESLQRVLSGSRSDLQRLQQRLQALLSAWDEDSAADGPTTTAVAPREADDVNWPAFAATVETTLRAALPNGDPRADNIAARLQPLMKALAEHGADAARLAAFDALCADARRLFGHRHHLVQELSALARELSQGLVDLAEDDSWARGQCESLQQHLSDEPSARGVRAASTLLAETRERQRRVREERNAARDALKSLFHKMVAELGELDAQTGRFNHSLERQVDAIAGADSLESLAGAVRELVDEGRAVQQIVSQTQTRLHEEHTRAASLESQVRALEDELRRLSDEVSTDALTQVANRRGLEQAFTAETSRIARGGAGPLALALIDIDNFKKLNDSLGHAAGDQALKALAAAVRERLRPVDHLARFGGEEFVVLLPDTAAADAQVALSRLQRNLSQSLFLHDQREVFVTFSAGVTEWRPSEPMVTALERADEALYVAKHSGKNRTCTA